jgi:hypothetical protein
LINLLANGVVATSVMHRTLVLDRTSLVVRIVPTAEVNPTRDHRPATNAAISRQLRIAASVTAGDRAISRPALPTDRLSINADPHDAVLVRRDGRNNVIGILKTRRVGPDCDWNATRFPLR